MKRLVGMTSPFLAVLMVTGALVLQATTARAAFPGANGWIAYECVGSFDCGIDVMNPDGSGNRHIIDGGWPAWSPNGQKIVYQRGPCCSQDIWSANADGSGATQLTNNANNEDDAAWSPDGKQIIFSRDNSGDFDIFVMNADGSNLHDITNSAGEDRYPTWSSTGLIAFTSARDGNYEIYTMNPDGTNQQRITNNPANDGAPIWSPDGSHLVFVSDRDGNYEIYTMDANGANQVRLTNSPSLDAWPAWSPDGSKIVFSSDRTGQEYIYTMDGDGSDQVLVSPTPGTQPDWRPIVSSNASVAVSDGGFSPKNVKVTQANNVVQWDFSGSASHAVSDGSGMGYFGSGSEPPGGAYAAAFPSAGTYSVLDPTTLATATVTVPVKVKPATGPPGTTFTITWSYAVPRPGFVFDVQIQTPGSNAWVYLEQGVTSKKTTIAPTDPGKYLFRARLRNGSGHSGWSPKASLTVEPICAPVPPDAVSWWPGNGDATDVIDGNDGVLKNGATFAPGMADQAFSFDGNDDFVRVPDAASLNPTELTIDAWVYWTGNQNHDNDLVSKDGEGSERQYLLAIGSINSRFIPAVWVTGGLQDFEGATQVQLNTWYYVAMTYDGQALTLYVNGNLDGSLPVNGSIVSGSQPVRIGGGAPPGLNQNYFQGLLDEVDIFSRALSQAEIRAIYKAGSKGKCLP